MTESIEPTHALRGALARIAKLVTQVLVGLAALGCLATPARRPP